MTKEELKIYISEAVDALDPVDLDILFPPNNQPDLYSVVEELTGLKGAFNKLSGSTLKLNHEIHSLVAQVELQQQKQEDYLLTLNKEEENAIETPVVDEDLKNFLVQLLDMDEVIQLAVSSYRELPEPSWLSLNQFKAKLAAWKKGFDITLSRWEKLLQTTNLYKTGLVGENFDPELHEAVAVKHQNDLVDNIILETEQTGYLYKGQVLKLAKVVVNKVKRVKAIVPLPVTILDTTNPNQDKETLNENGVTKPVEKKPKKSKKPKGKGGRSKKRRKKRN